MIPTSRISEAGTSCRALLPRSFRRRGGLVLLGAILTSAVVAGAAQTGDLQTLSGNAAAPEVFTTEVFPAGLTLPAPLPEAASAVDADRNYYVEPRSYGTRRETEPPKYVRNLGEIDWLDAPDDTWLDLGLDYRMRYEYRQNDLRRPVQVLDEPFLLRTRAYLGVKEIIDPFRFAVEFEDARRYNSQFPIDTRDVNENELIQGYGELYFADGVGDNRPLRIQYGRLAFEYMDRRLIARNEWRNTTNNFQGLRAIFGQQSNDWQFDLLAVQPIERLPFRLDRVDEERWFFGGLGDWRRWSEVVTIQPYWLTLYDRGNSDRFSRTISTLGVRSYGIVGETGYDFDTDFAFQVGRNGDEDHRAFGFTTEIGYSFEHATKPRLAAFVGYASGDRNPDDGVNQRFDRLYGFGRPWSADDYISWENVFTPKLRFEWQPHKKIRCDAGYSAYWLASDTDAWPNVNLRDPTGQSGSFMGQELDIRIRFPARDRTEVTLGYAHFFTGEFPRKLGKPLPSDFFYIELAPRLFK